VSEPLVDIGGNLTNKAFRTDTDAVLGRAAAAGVASIVITGTSAQASRLAWEIVADRRGLSSPRLFATAGVHPHHASTLGPTVLAEVASLAERPEVVAVGECGLDFNRNFSPPDAQKRAFEAQLEMAARVRKPVFLHERDAHEDFVAILEKWRPKLTGGVVHCFTGSGATLLRYLALDLHIGITGWICDERRGTHLRDLVPLIPKGRLMVETDSPYILPRDMPDRPKNGRNEPAFVVHVARTVAACRGETLEALAHHTTAAASELFRLAR
jgi:TatD DNase family protein